VNTSGTSDRRDGHADGGRSANESSAERASRGAGRGMILAAGLGRRLLPLTAYLPKPLLPVLAEPLLARAADRLRAAGVTRLIANTHHLADAVARYAHRERPDLRLTLSHEPRILGTGGALDGARDFLTGADWFVLWNGDVLCDLDVATLVADHLRQGSEATLLLVDWPAVNSVRLATDGQIVDIAGRLGATGTGRNLTYSGIAVFSRSFLRYIPAGYSSLVDALVAAIAAVGGSIRGYAPSALAWNDLGTVKRYLDAHAALLSDRDSAALWQGEGVVVQPGARLDDWNCLGSGVRVPASARLSECVVLAGVEVDAEVDLRRAVVGPGWVVTEQQNEILGLKSVQDAGFTAQTVLDEITGHGSDRRFWRLTSGHRQAVAMRVPPEEEEFDRFVAIAQFLYGERLGGPRLLTVDAPERTVVMESLGTDSLDDLAHAQPERRPRLYRQVLDLLVDLQVRGTAASERCESAADRRFDHATLRWETDYFRRRFLVGYAGLSADQLAALDDEFAALAQSVLAQPVVLMHRDFQSQNILIQDGRVRLVDFQGMRLGPVGYDLMSLLRDAYVDLGDELRDELVEYYRARLAAAGGPDPGAEVWGMWCTAAGLQRNMQALGAFGYLALVKGKRGFLAHIPLCLRYLRDGLHELRELRRSPGVVDFPPPLPELERAVDSAGQLI